MKSRLSKILLIIGAFISFLPVLGVDFFLDKLLRTQVEHRFNANAQTLVQQNQSAIFDSITSIEQILSASPSLCTPTFISNVQKQFQANHSLIQVIVENGDKVQYCDGFNEVVKYSILSDELPISTRSETIRVVQLQGQANPSFMIKHLVGANRSISSFVYINPTLIGVMPNYLVSDTSLKLSFTNGEQIIALGKPYSSDQMRDDHAMVITKAIAKGLPISAEIAFPFAKIKADFSWLYILLTGVFALLGIVILIFVLKSLRQSNIPVIDLERALELGELVPYYQPLINLNTGKVIGCESLLRWVKRNGEVIAPGMFIDYAESSGMAFPITISLMQKIASDLGDLCQEQPELKIGINLFEGHFRDTSIVEDVRAIFEDSKINYSQLVFEITERRPLKNQLAVDGVIGGLQALGCKIAMDDAGTGHSNLAYMQTLNIDIIKIDKVFVDMIEQGVNNVPILDGLIAIANDLGTGIVAEGVETQGQVNYLRANGVVEVQGFLFSPAIKPKLFIELTKKLNKISNVAPIKPNVSEKAA